MSDAIAIATSPAQPMPVAALEKLVGNGDLTGLTPQQRIEYVHYVCTSLSLNPATNPFDFMLLPARGSTPAKTILYAKKSCAEQLRHRDQVSVEIVEETIKEGVYIVRAKATIRGKDGYDRTDTDIGAVNIQGLTGNDLANAFKRAVTQAKRRVTLSVCGLGFPDESELDEMPGTRRVESFNAPALPAPEPRPEPIALSQLQHLHQLTDALPKEAVAQRLRTKYGVSEFRELNAKQAEEVLVALTSSRKGG